MIVVQGRFLGGYEKEGYDAMNVAVAENGS